MKIIYTKKYNSMIESKHFPVVGLWYSLIEIKGKFFDTYPEFYNGTCNRFEYLYGTESETGEYSGGLFTSGTDLPVSAGHKAKVLLKDGTCKMSITLSDEREWDINSLITVHAFDLIKDPNGFVGEPGDMSLYRNFLADPNNLSFVICPPSLTEIDQDIEKRLNPSPKVANIFEIKYPNCSFRNSVQTDSNADEVTHYVHGEIDRSILYETWSNEVNSFIESESGYERSRALQGDEKPKNINGHLTIGTNGLIHL